MLCMYLKIYLYSISKDVSPIFSIHYKPLPLQELECQVLQSLLFCMHAFLTAKVASVDPAFLSSIQQS